MDSVTLAIRALSSAQTIEALRMALMESLAMHGTSALLDEAIAAGRVKIKQMSQALRASALEKQAEKAMLKQAECQDLGTSLQQRNSLALDLENVAAKVSRKVSPVKPSNARGRLQRAFGLGDALPSSLALFEETEASIESSKPPCLEDFELVKKLGEGASATVWGTVHAPTNEPVTMQLANRGVLMCVCRWH